MQKLRGHWQLIVLTGIIYLLWATPVIWPLRMLIVLFHELSHAVVAILTGGEVLELSLSRREGGFVLYRGGSFFWTATAGYLGSLLIGVFLLIMAMRTTLDRVLLMGLGVVILLVTVLFVRDGFAILYMCAMSAVFLAVGWFLPAQVADLVLRIIGLVSLLYVPWDIASDTIFNGPSRPGVMSDAAALASRSFLTEWMVGGLWVLLSLAVIFFTLRSTLRAPSNINLQRAERGR